ncbi:hypothetical protein FF1_024480 [Malus domestica]
MSSPIPWFFLKCSKPDIGQIVPPISILNGAHSSTDVVAPQEMRPTSEALHMENKKMLDGNANAGSVS